MRHTRRLLLVLIIVIVAALGVVYRNQKATQTRNAPAPPPALPAGIAAKSSTWNYTQNDGNHVHSVWRDFNGDFGRDLLREHVQGVKHE